MEIQFNLRLLIFNVLSTSFTSFPFLNHCQASSVMFNIASIDYQRMSETAGLQETTMRKITKIIIIITINCTRQNQRHAHKTLT